MRATSSGSFTARRCSTKPPAGTSSARSPTSSPRCLCARTVRWASSKPSRRLSVVPSGADEIRDHGTTAPFLSGLDVREVYLDHGHARDLERIPDRVAVVGPGARIQDQPVGELGSLMQPLDVLVFGVRVKEGRLHA